MNPAYREWIVAEDNFEKRFGILCQITRAQHFAWREAVHRTIPDADMSAVVNRMWAITGEETGAAYLKHLDLKKPLAPQIAACIVWSSDSMGEDAVVEPLEDGSYADAAFVRHNDCPWFHWHKRLDLLPEDQPGCDSWLKGTLDHLGSELGKKIHFETVESLPEGGGSCLRRLWVEDAPDE